MNSVKKMLLGFFLIAIGTLFLIAIFRYASFLGFLMIYPYVLSAAFDITLNPYLAKALAIAMGLVLWFLIFKLFMQWDKEKRDLGFALLAVVFILHALAMFFITSDRLVDPRSGERKWCVEDKLSHEVKVLDAEGYDEFGVKSHPCTNADLESVIKKRRGMK